MRLGTPRDPPIEAGVVDQHDGVRALLAEIAIGSAGQLKESVQVHEHAQKPHHRQRRQILVQRAAGGRHFRPAVSDAFDARPRAAKLANQIRAVQVAARFAGREKDLHARLACGRDVDAWAAAVRLYRLSRVSAMRAERCRRPSLHAHRHDASAGIATRLPINRRDLGALLANERLAGNVPHRLRKRGNLAEPRAPASSEPCRP